MPQDILELYTEIKCCIILMHKQLLMMCYGRNFLIDKECF